MKPIRIAFSGAGFRIPGHVGALAAVEDAGYMPVQLAGTSAGSIVAALYAVGMPLADMRALCMSMNWSPMMAPTLGSILRMQAWSSGDRMLAFLREKTEGKRFCDLPEGVDLRIVAADLADNREFVFDRHKTPDTEIALAARASASIPGVYAPVLFHDHVLVDGGTADNMPASRLTPDDVPRLGIYLEARDGALGPGRHLWDLGPRIIDLMLASNEASQVRYDEHVGARIVRVQTGYASSFDRHMSIATRQRLYRDGYATTARELRLLPGWA